MYALVSLLPIITLLFCLLLLKWSVARSAAMSLCVSLILCSALFRPNIVGMSVIMAKGFSLALFVVLIIWGAILIYHLVQEVGALEVISISIEKNINDNFNQFLILCWIFSAFLQGIAGFGIPVMIVAPILIGLGFNPVVATAGVLVGHSWSISFGSMGSSIYAISMVTKVNLSDIVSYMTLYGLIALLSTGFSVCFIYGGWKCVREKKYYVILLSILMGITLWIFSRLEIYSIMGLFAGIVGLFISVMFFKSHDGKRNIIKCDKNKVGMFEAMLPYILIVFFSILFFLMKPSLTLRLDFPGYRTFTDVFIKPEKAYVSFNLLRYPFVIMIIAFLICFVIYTKKGFIDTKGLKSILMLTVDKCKKPTITIAFLLITAVIMIDSGMINAIASSLVSVTGKNYPLFASFIGLLGSFITGSNTNSNILFGSLQETVALSLGANTAVMCACQSISASVGGGIGPTTTSLGASSANIIGAEAEIYEKTLCPTLITVLILGIANVCLVLWL